MEKLLVVYITLGYPSIEKFTQFISQVGDCGASYIEVGIPPSFAKYDGPAIRRSYEYVKSLGINAENVLKIVAKNSSAPVIALTYLDDYVNNLDEFAEKMLSTGIEYVLLPDLLIDYVDMYRDIVNTLHKYGIKTTMFVSSSTPDKLIAEASKHSKPFLYFGLRPATGIPLPVDPVILVTRARKLVQNKLVVGFGLSIKDIEKVVKAGADGIAVGTAIIEAIEKSDVEKALELVKELRGVLDDL